MKRKLTAITGMLCAAAMTVSMAACNNKNSKEAEVSTFVSLDINPAIELTLDTDNKVVSVVGSNEDGKVLLYGEEGLIGVDVEVAVEKITDLAIDLGYINEDNKVVQASVTANGEVNVGNIRAKIDAKVDAVADKAGINVEVQTLDSYSLNRKLDEFKAKYPNNGVIQALTVPQFKLALSAAETGEVTLEAAVEMNTEELIKVVSEAHKQIEAYATEAYNKAKAEAMSAYDIAAGLVLDGVYSEFYAKNVISHPTTFYYGAAYQAYKLSATGFNAVADVLVFAEKIGNYPINEARVEAVASALGLTADKVELLKDNDGNITVNSIEAYADKVFKNLGETEEVKQMQAELTAALGYAEADVKAEIEKAIEKYAPQIETVLNAATTAVDTMKGALVLLPEVVTNQVDEAVKLFEDVAAELKNVLETGTLNEATLRGYADALNARADEILVNINADLSDEEKAEINSRRAELEGKLADAKQKLESAVAEAENKAKAQIERLKGERAA